MKRYKITRNSTKCLKCNDEIESKHRHDFKFCSCGAVGVDGGLDYSRRIGEPQDREDTSLYEEYSLDEYKSYLENCSKYLSKEEKEDLRKRIFELA